MKNKQQRHVYRPYLVHFLLLAVCLGSAVWNLPKERENKGVPAELNVFEIANLMPVELVPNFSSMTDVQRRKTMFFAFLKPYVDLVNTEMLNFRAQVETLVIKQGRGRLSDADKTLILSLSHDFEVESQFPYSKDHLDVLLSRVDVLPVSLVLVQAANESAWGTSRFARLGKNFFGQWCYVEGCGIVPAQRSSGATHEVKAFATVTDSVRSYFMNLNTFPSYIKLRAIRQELRANGDVIDGVSLSHGLDSYSARGEAYIDELQSMIHFNKLHELDDIQG